MLILLQVYIRVGIKYFHSQVLNKFKHSKYLEGIKYVKYIFQWSTDKNTKLELW